MCSDPNSVYMSVRPSVKVSTVNLFQIAPVRTGSYQTWIIGALWEPSHYDALGGHMTRSNVI